MPTLAQNRTIHALRRDIHGFNDEDYRALLSRSFSAQSSKDLSEEESDKLIAKLRKLKGGGGAVKRMSANTLSGPYAKALQALWIAAWNLGIVRNRDDSALISFINRQTGLSHDRFLIHAADARRAIDGLKGWIAREGGVIWPKDKEDIFGRKLAIVEAIAEKLRQIDARFEIEDFAQRARLPLPSDASAHQLDRLAGKMGETLRDRLQDVS